MAWQIDLTALTLEEIEVLCEKLGIETQRELQAWATKAANADDIPIKQLRVFVWLAKRQEDPGFTYEQAGKLTTDEMQEMMADPNAPRGGAASSANGTGRSSNTTKAQSRRRASGV